MKFQHSLYINNLLEKKSHFLFGPDKQVNHSLLITLYLTEVHLLIENNHTHFLLTGSSARKLKHSAVNLLSGRARVKHLLPLTSHEIGQSFNLTRALNHGLLPSIYLSNEPQEDLNAYVGTYLKEEIAAEGLTRNIPAFSRFLEVAALCNGHMINYTNLSNDAQVARTTVQEYFQILKDTLIGYELLAYKESVRRKPITTSKFYFFDTGVVRVLKNRREIAQGSPEFGELFENYILHELNAYSEYIQELHLTYWRSKSGYEVDFTINHDVAIEVKSSSTISTQDLKGLIALREEQQIKQFIVVCFEKHPRMVNNIHIMPWEMFLKQLWNNSLIKAHN